MTFRQVVHAGALAVVTVKDAAVGVGIAAGFCFAILALTVGYVAFAAQDYRERLRRETL